METEDSSQADYTLLSTLMIQKNFSKISTYKHRSHILTMTKI